MFNKSFFFRELLSNCQDFHAELEINIFIFNVLMIHLNVYTYTCIHCVPSFRMCIVFLAIIFSKPRILSLFPNSLSNFNKKSTQVWSCLTLNAYIVTQNLKLHVASFKVYSIETMVLLYWTSKESHKNIRRIHLEVRVCFFNNLILGYSKCTDLSKSVYNDTGLE